MFGDGNGSGLSLTGLSKTPACFREQTVWKQNPEGAIVATSRRCLRGFAAALFASHAAWAQSTSMPAAASAPDASGSASWLV
jgi:hypothetical protein